MHGVGLEGFQMRRDSVDAVGGLLDNSKVKLFQNNHIPVLSDLEGAFTPPTFIGYAPKTVAAWDGRGVDPDGVPYVTTSMLHFECTDGTIDNTIYGAIVMRDQVLLSGVITGATAATPIVITDVAHGLATGDRITIVGVTGEVEANGTFTVTRLTADTFSLDGSVGVNAYVAGGTWDTVPWGPGLMGKFAAPVAITEMGDAVNCIIKLREDGQVFLLLASDI